MIQSSAATAAAAHAPARRAQLDPITTMYTTMPQLVRPTVPHKCTPASQRVLFIAAGKTIDRDSQVCMRAQHARM